MASKDNVKCTCGVTGCTTGHKQVLVDTFEQLRRAAERRAVEQRDAERRAAEQRAAEQRAAKRASDAALARTVRDTDSPPPAANVGHHCTGCTCAAQVVLSVQGTQLEDGDSDDSLSSWVEVLIGVPVGVPVGMHVGVPVGMPVGVHVGMRPHPTFFQRMMRFVFG